MATAILLKCVRYGYEIGKLEDALSKSLQCEIENLVGKVGAG